MLPIFKCGHGTDDGFLAGLHRASDSLILQIDRVNQLLPSGHNSASRRTQVFVSARDDKVRARLNQFFQSHVLGCSIDNDRHSEFMSQLNNLRQSDPARTCCVMRFHVHDGGDLSTFQLQTKFLR